MSGKKCRRTETSFYQDIDYLSETGKELTTSQGLCNIGEWHSHHRINLPEPSEGDQTTVWKHVKSFSGGRFLLLIATIVGSAENPRVKVGCFMFSYETKEMSKGTLVTLKGASPIREQFDDKSFQSGPEDCVSWVDFVAAHEAARKAQTVSDDDAKRRLIPKKMTWYGSSNDYSKSPKNERTEMKKSSGDLKVVTNQPEHISSQRLPDVVLPYVVPRTVSDDDAKKRLIPKEMSRYGSTENYSENEKSRWGLKDRPKFMSSQRMYDVVSPSNMENMESEKQSIFDCCCSCMCSKRRLLFR